MRFLNKNFFIKFFIVDFVFFAVFYVTFITTFPIKQIVENNKDMISQKTGKIIKYKDVSLSFGLSINVEDLEIISINEDVKTSKKNINKKNNNSTSLNNQKEKNKISKLFIKKLTVSPNISEMMSSKTANLDFDASLMKGNINGNFTVVVEEESQSKKSKNSRYKNKRARTNRKIEKNKIFLNLKSIDLMALSKYFQLDLPYSGKLSGVVDTTFASRNGKAMISALELDLDMKKSKIGPGKVKAMGSFVTIDTISLGNFEIKGKTSKKSTKFKLEPLKVSSSDIDIDLTGAITFGRNIMPNLKLKFKFTDELLKTNKKIKAVMGGFSNMKRKDGSYGVKLTGTMKHLRQRPWKR